MSKRNSIADGFIYIRRGNDMAIAPSLKRLCAAFPSVDPENLKRIRALIREGRKLGACNKLLDTFGVEYVRNAQDGIVCAYLNSGDTYSPTLLLRTGSSAVQLTTLGDFVETYERNHARLP